MTYEPSLSCLNNNLSIVWQFRKSKMVSLSNISEKHMCLSKQSVLPAYILTQFHKMFVYCNKIFCFLICIALLNTLLHDFVKMDWESTSHLARESQKGNYNFKKYINCEIIYKNITQSNKVENTSLWNLGKPFLFSFIWTQISNNMGSLQWM